MCLNSSKSLWNILISCLRRGRAARLSRHDGRGGGRSDSGSGRSGSDDEVVVVVVMVSIDKHY
jgi:hypothetical protein